MANKLAFLLLPILLLAAACTSGGGSGSAPTEVADPPGSNAEATDAPDTSGAGDAGDSADAGSDPFASLNPFDVLGGLNGAQVMSAPDPVLADALITQDDLPDGFSDMGSYGFAMPSDVGTAKIAASMFTSGAIESGEFNAMVMSAVIAVPPEALAEMEGVEELTEEDLDEIADMAGASGLGFAQMDLLDADGLGDGGFGMRMTMDFADLFGALGAPSDEANPLAAGITMEMYGFLDGDQMRMVMVMSPTGGSTGVDARDLAETMDDK
jgi:hypothetical protein